MYNTLLKLLSVNPQSSMCALRSTTIRCVLKLKFPLTILLPYIPSDYLFKYIRSSKIFIVIIIYIQKKKLELKI